jgi:hypothetical protein
MTVIDQAVTLQVSENDKVLEPYSPARRNMLGAAEVGRQRSVRFVISAGSARIWPGITASGLSRT